MLRHAVLGLVAVVDSMRVGSAALRRSPARPGRAPLALTVLLTLWSSCAAVHAEPSESIHDGIRVREGFVDGLRYLEVVPEDASPDARLPMVVWLHGRGDAARAPDGPFLGLVQMRLIIPEAPDPHRNGYTWLPVSAAPGESAPLVEGLRTRADQLASAIRTLEERHPTRGSPIVMGFSQGGMLTMTLAVHHPEVVGDAFPVAGWLPPSLSPNDGPTAVHPPIRAMHGADDPVLPAPRTRDAVERLQRRGYDVELQVFDGIDHQTSPDMWRQLRKWLRAALRERDVSNQADPGLA